MKQVRGEDAHDPTNFLVAFDDSEARYMVIDMVRMDQFTLLYRWQNGSLLILVFYSASANKTHFKEKEIQGRKNR